MLLTGSGSDGGEANVPNESGCTALHLATLHGHAGAAEALLDASADPNAQPAGGGPAPLHLAAKKGAAPLVELLLSRGAALQARMVPSGETPLHLSAQQPACCELLLSCGADVEERDAAGCTPLQHAVCGVEPLRASKALLAAGASPNTADFTSGQRAIAERSPRDRRDVAERPPTSPSGQTPLHRN
mmetsp:Transcript_4539/g.15194  ORF Transcript_4539/g.15194 Transcript_4539/m.15194 type:complete len:187 (+) Transcript_4539:99-659(+)